MSAGGEGQDKMKPHEESRASVDGPHDVLLN